MTVQSLTIGKREFVLLERKALQRMEREAELYRLQLAEDAADRALIRRKMADKRDKVRPYAEVRKTLGPK